MSTQITYINKSYHQNKPTVLVYMQPSILPYAAKSTAWQVIKNIGYNSWHKFNYPVTTSVQAIWDNNCHSAIITGVTNGKNYCFEETDSGFALVARGSSLADNQFDVTNKTNIEEISVVALKDGNPIQIKHHVARNQKVVFELNPTLYFGISSKYKVGDIVDSEAVMKGLTAIFLEGSSNLTVSMRGDATNSCSFLTFYGKSYV